MSLYFGKITPVRSMGKLPYTLDIRLRALLGDDYEGVVYAFSNERRGFFRINTLKSSLDEVLAELANKNIEVQAFDAILGVFSFEKKTQEYALKGTDAFYQGKIYLQSLASMIPVLALAPKPGMRVLDVCAAPGSKTTQMAMLMQNTGTIVALEHNQIRYDKLIYNTRLQGAHIIEGQKMDARKYLASSDEIFDAILLDAPCSAEGRINLQNEKSYGFWSLENITRKSELQYELFSLALKRLAPGGILVYSTCTLAPEENEGVIARILAEHDNLTIESIDLGLSERAWWRSGLTDFGGVRYSDDIKNTTRILPSDETEGFFIAKISKNKRC